MSQKRHGPADEPHFLVRTTALDLRDGASLSHHEHAWDQLIYACTGVLSVWTERGSWVAPPRWAVWAPAGIAHAITCTGASSLRTLYLRPESRDRALRTSCVVAVSPLLRELVLRAVALGVLDDREPVHVALASLVVHELRAVPAPSFELPMPRDERLRRIAEHLVATPADRDDHEALARRFATSARTLERDFLRETGLSLGRWRQQARFLHALRRLGAGASVKEVATESGYRSASAFVAAFRSELGTTPGRYFAQSADR